jgi:hypothetical protein
MYMQPHKHTAFARYCNVTQTVLYHSATTKSYFNLIILWIAIVTVLILMTSLTWQSTSFETP